MNWNGNAQNYRTPSIRETMNGVNIFMCILIWCVIIIANISEKWIIAILSGEIEVMMISLNNLAKFGIFHFHVS